MSKKRTIMPNTKVDKNNIGKQGLRFDEIYADNIITDKINNKKVDPDYYLKDNFCIIYPNNGSKEAPANISVNTRYVMDNPFPGYFVYCITEVMFNEKWGAVEEFYTSSSFSGYRTHQLEDKIIIRTGQSYIMVSDFADGNPHNTGGSGIAYKTFPARTLVWKVGKIPDDN